MKKNYEVVGWVLTAIYLFGIALLVCLKKDSLHTLELNSIGDFLAGVFGPIAFLWLVLGYKQQGRELKISSDALRLQAKELRNSVEQQSKLVAVAADQLKFQQEAFDLQAWRHQQEISPRFDVKLSKEGLSGLSGLEKAFIKIHNAGHAARFVTVRFDGALGVAGTIDAGDMKEGETIADLVFQYPTPSSDVTGYFDVEYLRVDDKFYRDRFLYGVLALNGQFLVMKADTDLLASVPD